MIRLSGDIIETKKNATNKNDRKSEREREREQKSKDKLKLLNQKKAERISNRRISKNRKTNSEESMDIEHLIISHQESKL